MTGDRCGSGIEWVPYNLSEESGIGGGGGKDPYLRGGPREAEGPGGKPASARLSWREREGREPVEAGPYWHDVKDRLECSGVDVWWSPGGGHHAPRRAPQGWADSIRGEDGGVDALAVGAVAAVDTEFDGAGGVGGRGYGEPGAEGVMRGAPATASPVTLLVILLCVLLAGICLAGQQLSGRSRRRRRRRKRPRRLEVRVDDWSGNAFSTGSLSPLVGTSFVWKTDATKNRKA